MEGNVCARAQKGERKFEPLSFESCILLRSQKKWQNCLVSVSYLLLFFILGLS